VILCESVHLICENDAQLEEHSLTPRQIAVGGGVPTLRIRTLVRLRSFKQANMVATARIGWIEVGSLSLRIVGYRYRYWSR